MTHEQLKIQSVTISKLKPALYNPRKWSKDAIEQLTESIRQFGMVDPILVNGAEGRSNVVIGGHFRLKVAKDLGYKDVPVVYLDIPEEAKERELNLRLNRNLGDWDFELLATLVPSGNCFCRYTFILLPRLSSSAFICESSLPNNSLNFCVKSR